MRRDNVLRTDAKVTSGMSWPMKAGLNDHASATAAQYSTLRMNAKGRPLIGPNFMFSPRRRANETQEQANQRAMTAPGVTIEPFCPTPGPLRSESSGTNKRTPALMRRDNVFRTIATQPSPDGKPSKTRHNHRPPTVEEGKETTASTPRRRERPRTSAPLSPLTSPVSRILSQERPSSSRGPFSTAMNLGTGERLVQDLPNLALKVSGSSEMSASMVDQLMVIFRDQLADERREDERIRVERDAERDAEFQTLQRKVNNLDGTIASSVTGSLSIALNSPEFPAMIAQTVQAGIYRTLSAPKAAQHKGGPDHNVDPREK